MQFYETLPPDKTEQKRTEVPTESEHGELTVCSPPKDRAAAGENTSGGFRLTVLQTVICVLVLLAALFMHSFLPELYSELRARCDAELNKSILITQDDVSHS